MGLGNQWHTAIYRVFQVKQPGNDVSLTSYRKTGDTEGIDIQISENGNGKPSSKISALAEQVFGVQTVSQQTKSTAGAPVS